MMSKKRQTSIYNKRYRELIEALKDVRKKRGITQAELSKKTGLPQYDISKIETYVRRLDAVELEDYLKGLDIDLDIVALVKKHL